MAMSDPLGDMLTRLRNGQQAGHSIVECPYSKLRENVCKVLQEEGYISGFAVSEIDGKPYTLCQCNTICSPKNLVSAYGYSGCVSSLSEVGYLSGIP